MRKEELRYKLLRGIYNYFMFFLLVAFLVSCSMLLFLNVMADSLKLTLTSENIGLAAKLTFGNVVFLSILFTVIDAVRRKLTTEKITKHIAEAAKKLVQGDFSVRIAPVSSLSADENFNEIIVGIITGVSGISLAALAYPVYSKVLKREREKIAPEILRLTDELMK